jgi:membrane protein DedA with SNARE-associated domain
MLQSALEGNWSYLAIFFFTVLESACVPIPSEVTLGLGGALASGAVISGSHAHLNLGVVILVAIAGSLVGSMLAYVVGRTGGRALVDRFGKYVLLTHADLDRSEAWFARRGEPVVLFGRVIPVIRTFISLPAGMAEMNVTKFLVFTTIGVTAWVSLLCSIGYALGDSYASVTKGFGYAGYVVAAAIVVALALWAVHRYRAIKAQGAVRATDRATTADPESVSARGE